MASKNSNEAGRENIASGSSTDPDPEIDRLRIGTLSLDQTVETHYRLQIPDIDIFSQNETLVATSSEELCIQEATLPRKANSSTASVDFDLTQSYGFDDYVTCLPMGLILEDLRNVGGQRFRKVKQAAEDGYRELMTLLSPEDSVDPGEVGRLTAGFGDSLKTVMDRASREITNSCQGVLGRMKEFGVQMNAKVQGLHQPVNGPSHDDSQQECSIYEGDCGSGRESQEERLVSFEPGEEELEAGPDLPPFVEREDMDMGSSAQSGNFENRLADVGPDYADEQIDAHPRDHSPTSTPGEHSRGRTSERSAAGCSRTRTMSLAARSIIPAEDVSGSERMRANSEPSAMCLNCNQDPMQESDKIVLHRSLKVENKCHYCREEAPVEICVRTNRYICGREQCQKRREIACRKATTERN